MEANRSAIKARALASLFAMLWLGVINGSCLAQVVGNMPRIDNAQEYFFKSDDVRIRYLVAGHGEPVMLVHGWSASAEMWATLMNDLSKDHEVIAMVVADMGRATNHTTPRSTVLRWPKMSSASWTTLS